MFFNRVNGKCQFISILRRQQSKIINTNTAFCIFCVCFSSLHVFGASAVFEGHDPLLWQQQPHANVSHTVQMSVEPIDSAGTTEYFFDCIKGAAPDSGWQGSTEYTVTGLTPQSTYTFVAKVRGQATGTALAADSEPIAVSTPAAGKFDRIIADEIEIIPIFVNGNKYNRINILVMNRWVSSGGIHSYNRPELRQEFIDDIKKTCQAFDLNDPLAEKPFANFREFFNVYAVWWPSVPEYQNGWDVSDYQELRDRLFLPWQTEGKGWVSLMAMVNSDSGGGGAGRNLDRRVGDAMIAGNDIDPFLHEFSHTAMGCGDKYIGWGTWGGKGAPDETFVSTHWYQRDRVPWKAWIDKETPIPTPYSKKYFQTIGVYEGGIHRIGHIFRSSPYCIMGVNQFAEHLCATCVQRGTQRVYTWVDVFDSTRPIRKQLTLKKPGTAQFRIDRVKGTPDTQAIEWRLNGKVIACDVEEVEVPLGAIEQYEMVCSIVDHTELIRHDPPYSSRPRAEVRWQIDNPLPQSRKSPLAVTLKPTNPNCWGQNDGEVQIEVTGGKPPYNYQWSNGETGKTITGLDGGDYTVDIVDSEFRRATATCTLERPLSLDVDIRSYYLSKNWQIVLTIIGSGKEDVTCKWSSGATGLKLDGVPDGTYRYLLTHKNGDSFSDAITVRQPSPLLNVTVDEVIPSSGENNGEIRLAVVGGKPPYQVVWSDGKETNKTSRAFLSPGDYRVVVKDENQTAIEEIITIDDVETFIFERPEFDRSAAGLLRILNPQEGYRYLWYDADHPMHVNRPPRGLYEGFFHTADGKKVEATGSVIESFNGKWATFSAGYKKNPNNVNDYSSWLRLDAYFDGLNANPKTVKLETTHSGSPGESLHLSGSTIQKQWNLDTYEIPLKADWKGWIKQGHLYLDGKGPDGGCFDLRYTGRHENPAKRLAIGSEFRPDKPGNYYVAAQRISSGAVSYNRVGVAVTQNAPSLTTAPVNPAEVKSAKLLLWLDPSDINADGKVDTEPWTNERGIVHGWKDKASDNVFDRIHYLPNAQNGLPIADFKYLWAQRFANPVEKFQTVIMIYREHELSKTGSSMWRDSGLCFWDLTNASGDFITVPKQYAGTTAYLNGTRVDPYATSSPIDEYCVATFELPENNGVLKSTNPLWEGSMGEMVVYDSLLSEKERKGVEEYFRQKWISTISLVK